MQLDFTRDGRFLISVGLDDSHTAGIATQSRLLPERHLTPVRSAV